MSANIPISNQPFLYINNLKVSNNATTPNTKIDVSLGECRDSTDTNDIVVTAAGTIDASINGVDGLDTGSLAASTWYYVYAIGSSLNVAQPARLLSASATAPNLPAGYDVFRVIGYMLTDGSVHFLKCYISGNNNSRKHFWDADIAVLTSGTATSLTAISLASAIPPVDYTPVQIVADYTPATAGDSVSFAPFGSTATLLPHVTGSVAAKANSAQLTILSRLDTATPKILYINSAASGDADVWVSGFEYFI